MSDVIGCQVVNFNKMLGSRLLNNLDTSPLGISEANAKHECPSAIKIAPTVSL